MAIVTVDISENTKKRFNIGDRILFDDFVVKLFGDAFISPDLTFTPVENLSKQEKKELSEAKKYDKNKLINI